MSKEIKLTRKKIALIDKEDYKYLSQFNWSYHTTSAGRGYAYNRDLGYMHRVIMGNPIKLIVDHRNNDGLDNRKDNLRLCTHAQNSQNRRPTNGKKYKGTYLFQNKWGAKIGYKGRQIFLGYYKTQKEAAIAYNKKASELCGEFAMEIKV